MSPPDTASARTSGARGWRIGAVAAFCLTTVLYAVAVVLTVVMGEPLWPELFFALGLYSFCLVGALIALRRPRNRVAWLCLAIGFVWGLAGVTELLIAYERIHPGLIPRPELLFAVSDPLWVPGVGLMATFLLLLFPDGNVPSPRWRPLAWLSSIAILMFYAVFLFSPAQTVGPEPLPGLENPLEFEALAGLDWVVAPMYFGCILASLVALVVRYRRSAGIERLQLKWLVSAGAAAILALLLLNMLMAFGIADAGPADLVDAVVVGLYASIPAAIGIAVLRYRLYAIDRLVSRTVSYAVVVGVLVAVYAAGVFLLRGLLPLEGDLAVAASTLAVAALFNPLRRRVQHRVERRFNRPRYDAQLEVERFTSRLRTELDPDDLAGDLLGVVAKTVQPSTASVWIRGDRR